jgi:putative tricarboxylic transport membrane protein
MKIADRLVGAALLAFAVYVFIVARSMEFLTEGVPGPGFVPFWVSLVMGVSAILILVKSGIKPLTGMLIADRGALRRTLAFSAGIVAIPLLTPFIGMILTLALFMAFAVPLLGVRKWTHVLAAAILVPAFVYFLFQYILQVPLPVMPWRS